MRPVTCTFSDQFMTDLMEVSRIFGGPADVGAVIEHYAGYALDLLANDEDHLSGDLVGRTWDTEAECREVAARVVEKYPDNAPYAVRESEERPGRWQMLFNEVEGEEGEQ